LPAHGPRHTGPFPGHEGCSAVRSPREAVMRRSLRRFATMTALVSTLGFGLVAHADPKTERTWKAKCGSCHGADGKGDTAQGKKMDIADMSKADWQSKFSDGQLKKAIEDGLKRDKGGKKQSMEAYGKKLKGDEIAALVTFIRSLKK